jgi:diguanylate cyclase (GGDEF)-like protein
VKVEAMKSHFELKSLLFVLIAFACVVLLTDFTSEIGLFWFLYAAPAFVAGYYYGVAGGVVMSIISFATLGLWVWYLDIFSVSGKSSSSFWEFFLGILFFLIIAIFFGIVAERWRKSKEELEHCSVREPLTGLYNYGYFVDRLNQEISRADRYDYPLSLIMIDIDRFRDFNDTYGNQKGNLLISKIAKIIKRCVRTADVVCRYGGEEFSVILPNVDSDADVVAERIRKEIEKASFEGDVEHPQVRKTISCGVATFPADATSDTELIVSSDEALYMAKEAGRNKVCSYSRDCAKPQTKEA